MESGGDRPVVFIHTNAKQRLGALVSAHSFRLTAADPDAFEVRLLEAESYPALMQHGRRFRRAGVERAWDPDDLQSFTPLRFAVPDAMGHRGRALVVDPDVFAVGDAAELLGRDMEGRAIWCVGRAGHNDAPGYLATSVMLLDCARLPHWDLAARLEDLWAGRLDYVDWIELRLEDRATIGLLAPEWNHFDTLTPDTRLLHTTKRRTQPWKTGLPVDYTLREHRLGPVPAAWTAPLSRLWTRTRRYQPHPDPNQEAYFFALLADLLDTGVVDRATIEAAIAARHVRPDTLHLIDRHRGRLWPARMPLAAAQ